jgi:hypothetical protein
VHFVNVYTLGDRVIEISNNSSKEKNSIKSKTKCLWKIEACVLGIVGKLFPN